MVLRFMNSVHVRGFKNHCHSLVYLSLWLLGSMVSGFAFAHNAQQASFNVVLDGTESYVDIYLSQYGIEQALKASQPTLSSNAKGVTLFKQRLIEHIKTHTNILLNGRTITLGGGMLKLGSHESRVRLKLNNVPTEISDIEARVNCFSNNTHQVNVLNIIRNGTKHRYRLSQENGYQMAFSWVS